MKKVFIFLLVFLSIKPLFSQNLIDFNEEKLTNFTNKLVSLPFSERDVIIKACQVFEQDFSNDPYCADWAFQILYYYHQISCEDKTITLQKTYSGKEIRGYFYDDIYVLPKLKKNISAFIKEYALWGYRIASKEDTSYCIEVDSTFLIKRLGKYLSKDFAYYFNNYVADLSSPPYWHSQLNVPIEEIMRRVAWRDELLDRNPDFCVNNLVTLQIDYLLFSITKGLEHTPIYGINEDELKIARPVEGFDFANISNQSEVILPEYKKAIQDYYKAHTSTYWGKFLTEFMHKLSLNKYRFSNEIDDFVINTLYPKDRKNIDPLLKFKDIMIDNLMD
ncbi:MAG: hypothetical protein LBM25_07655 [Bacteroidales bacterium]|jgi:hypothetical protein|nr:hypothetical protein [Bacteroidales bacterium]